VRWAFWPDAEREALLPAISEQYAGLAGFGRTRHHPAVPGR
jgi:hypothetical protein